MKKILFITILTFTILSLGFTKNIFAGSSVSIPSTTVPYTNSVTGTNCSNYNGLAYFISTSDTLYAVRFRTQDFKDSSNGLLLYLTTAGTGNTAYISFFRFNNSQHYNCGFSWSGTSWTQNSYWASSTSYWLKTSSLNSVYWSNVNLPFYNVNSSYTGGWTTGYGLTGSVPVNTLVSNFFSSNTDSADYGSTTIPNYNYTTYYYSYSPVLDTNTTRKADTKNKCTINQTGTDYYLTCSGEYKTFSKSSSSSSFVQTYAGSNLSIKIAQSESEICNNIIGSNYAIYSNTGTPLCTANKNDFITTNILGNAPQIGYTAPQEDWGELGIFNFLKTPLESIMGGIDSMISWLWDLAGNILGFFIPNPENFQFYFDMFQYDFKQKINTDNLESFASEMKSVVNSTTAQLPTFNFTFHGVSSNINFTAFSNAYTGTVKSIFTLGFCLIVVVVFVGIFNKITRY